MLRLLAERGRDYPCDYVMIEFSGPTGKRSIGVWTGPFTEKGDKSNFAYTLCHVPRASLPEGWFYTSSTAPTNAASSLSGPPTATHSNGLSGARSNACPETAYA